MDVNMIMEVWKRNLFVLWTGVFFCSMAFSMSIPFLSLYISSDLHVETNVELWSGLTFGITFLASALISPYWGSLADKYGRKPMLLRSGFALIGIYVLTAFVTNPYELLAVRILAGLLSGYVPAAIALVGTNTPEHKVGYALGVMSTASASGSILGPMVGGLMSSYFGYRDTFLLSAVVVAVAAFIALFGIQKENFNRNLVRSSVIGDIKQAAANRPLMKHLFVVMIISGSIMVLEPLLTLYVLDMGVSHGDASFSSGIIFSAVGIATVFAAPQWGKLGARIGYEKTLMIGLIGGAIGNTLQFFIHGLIGFGILRFIYGLFFAAVYPSLNALIVKTTSPDFRGRAFSLNQSANQLGTLMGPIAGGALAGFVSIPVVFIINGVLLLVTAGTLKLRDRRKRHAASL